MTTNLIVITKEELSNLIDNSIKKAIAESNKNNFDVKTYSINKAAKILNMHADTLRKKINAGFVKTTADGKKISGVELENYLKDA